MKSSKIRHSKNGILTPKKLCKAIVGSGGILMKIAERCGVSYTQVQNALRKKGNAWDFVRQKFYDEVERVKDIAEETIQEMISQRLDQRLAADTAKWYLQRRRPDLYGEKTTLDIHTKETSICIMTRADLSKLPLNTRLELLKHVKGEVLEGKGGVSCDV